MVVVLTLALVTALPDGDFDFSVFHCEAVYKELKVSPEVRRKIERILVEEMEAQHAHFGTVSEAYRAAGKGDPDFIPSDLDLARNTTRRITGLLTREQRARLKELVLQDRGLWALLEPPVIKALNLAPDTVELIRQALERQSAEEMAAIPKFTPSRKEEIERQDRDTEKVQRLIRRNYETDVMKLLTRKQRARFRAMQGKPFDWKAARNAEEAKDTASDQPSAEQTNDPGSKTRGTGRGVVGRR